MASSVETFVRQILQEWEHDQDQLIHTIEAAAQQKGDDVYQAVFRILFDRNLDPARAGRYWREAIARWHSRADLQPAQQVLKTALFDYLQNMIRDKLASVTDGLTGLFNQSYCQTHLEQLLAAKRNNQKASPLAVLAIGIDNFPRLLEQLTPPESDRCLRHIGQIIRRHVRDMDSACWQDGGRYCLILPETTRQQAFAVAERIRNAVLKEGGPDEGKLADLKLTISIGLASFPESGSRAQRLLEAAAAELQSAQLGGNATCPVEAERRRQQRNPVCSMVEVGGTELDGYHPAMALNISHGGVAIGCDLALKVGALLTIRFRRPYWSQDREVRGLVRQASGGKNGGLPFFGLEFFQPEPGLLPPFGCAIPSL